MKTFWNVINTLCTDFGITLSGMVLTIMLIFPFIHNDPIIYFIGLGIVASFEILKMAIFKKDRLGKFERGIINITFVFAVGIAIHPIYQPLFGISPLAWPVIVFNLLIFQAFQALIVRSYFRIR
jgi:hypothetical protein